jgi:hypothetical protein
MWVFSCHQYRSDAAHLSPKRRFRDKEIWAYGPWRQSSDYPCYVRETNTYKTL